MTKMMYKYKFRTVRFIKLKSQLNLKYTDIMTNKIMRN